MLQPRLAPTSLPRSRRNESWPPQMIGNGALAPACDVLRQIDRQLKALTRSSEQQP
ncbi:MULTISPECIES: hypothetical protein [unclassified Bradyrhizobium]|jgi:hypothetical protein|uniref:hypothetical protein n=1 Tax=unclassified Bradyrhizobium TaxID=2631580 RepID=UPI0023B00B4C|nr:hypothetical protein [Bradyrhizobium sp. CSS354]MDE5463631.1 hypothetical protein [Bradyrhizobium sp. CSS354]